MKLKELSEGILFDKFKMKLGQVKGLIVSSMMGLLSKFKKDPEARLTTIEEFEIIKFGKSYPSRVDTGASFCSIDAQNIIINNGIVSFSHNHKEYELPLIRMKIAKNANASVERAHIALDYRWNNKTYHSIETSLSDRTKMNFQCLIGRNLIKELMLPVHININEK